MPTFNPLAKFKPAKVSAAFSRRSDGNMSFVYGDTRRVLENRNKFLSGLGINYTHLITAKQVHGKNVTLVLRSDQGRGALDGESSIPDTDGFITAERGLPIAVLTADCLSVFIYDPATPAIAILHAGWRSTEQNIAQQGVKAMQSRFASQPEDLVVGFGPSIRSCCFQVEPSFKSNFSYGLLKRDGHTFMDIALINRRQLVDSGVKEKSIFDPQFCTYSGDDFFSFRKEAQSAGRLISVIMLK